MLGYKEWRNFKIVLDKAIISCRNSDTRYEMKEHNKSLAEAAKQVGVRTPQEYAVFQNKGYQGLYGEPKHQADRKGTEKQAA